MKKSLWQLDGFLPMGLETYRFVRDFWLVTETKNKKGQAKTRLSGIKIARV